jgi:hypothetical protein
MFIPCKSLMQIYDLYNSITFEMIKIMFKSFIFSIRVIKLSEKRKGGFSKRE